MPTRTPTRTSRLVSATAAVIAAAATVSCSTPTEPAPPPKPVDGRILCHVVPAEAAARNLGAESGALQVERLVEEPNDVACNIWGPGKFRGLSIVVSLRGELEGDIAATWGDPEQRSPKRLPAQIGDGSYGPQVSNYVITCPGHDVYVTLGLKSPDEALLLDLAVNTTAWAKRSMQACVDQKR